MPAHEMYVDFRTEDRVIFQCPACAHRVGVDTETGQVSDIDRGDSSVMHSGSTGDVRFGSVFLDSAAAF